MQTRAIRQNGKTAPEVMRELVQFVDRGIANEEACQLALHDSEHAYHLPSSQNWFDRWCLAQEEAK